MELVVTLEDFHLQCPFSPVPTLRAREPVEDGHKLNTWLYLQTPLLLFTQILTL